jgi:hypothetical protein
MPQAGAYANMAGLVLGAAGSSLGAWFSGGEANDRRAALKKIANIPGVSLPSVYDDTFGAAEASLGRASNLASSSNALDLADLNSLYETSIPGFGAMQRQRAGNTGSLLAGEIPDDVSGQVFRGSAARALGGGYGGSPAFRNLAARDLGLTSLDLMNQGGQNLESMIRSTPMPRVTQTSDLLSINPDDVLGLRSGERSKRLDLLTGAINSPTDKDVWGRFLQEFGNNQIESVGGWGGAMGGGMGSIMGGSGGGSGGGGI